MIRIRKNGDKWEVRQLSASGYTWHFCSGIEELQQIIINTAVRLDYYVKLALEVIHGRSENYLLHHNKVISKKPSDRIMCLTPLLQHRVNLETIIYMLQSNIWVIREWKTPKCLEHFSEDSWLPEKYVKKSYQIIETTNDKFIPSDFEFISTDEVSK